MSYPRIRGQMDHAARLSQLSEQIAEWPETYIRKCLLAPREGDNLFFLTESDHWLATIEGYAIIPMEMYDDLAKKAALGKGDRSMPDFHKIGHVAVNASMVRSIEQLDNQIAITYASGDRQLVYSENPQSAIDVFLTSRRDDGTPTPHVCQCNKCVRDRERKRQVRTDAST